MKRALICLATLALAALPAAAQEAPEVINYQGLLTDVGGVPLATGNYDLEFSLYSDPAGGEANRVWGPETHASTQVIEGRFNVILGGTSSFGDAFSRTECYLGVSVNHEEEITPRHQVLSVPYALNSNNGVPIGTIVMWWGNVADIPAGWLLCDGQSISEGPLAGTDTPDMCHFFPMGAEVGHTTRDQLISGGTDMLEEQQLPEHSHNLEDNFLMGDTANLLGAFDQAATDPDSHDYDQTHFGHRTIPGEPPLNRFGEGYSIGNGNVQMWCEEFVFVRHQTGGLNRYGVQAPFLPSFQELFFIIRIY